MLSPSYLLHATEPAEEIAEKLHTDIMNRIIERIKIRFDRGDDYILTAVDKWQIETLQEAGFLLDDIQKEIAAATGYMQSEIKEAMEDAGVRALQYDDRIYRETGLDPVPLVQSPYLIDIMQRDFEATLGEWKNFTRTTAGAAEQAFIKACDDAYHQALTGLISPSQAVHEALEKIIDGGVYVDYPSGHRDTIETATTRAVRTGISQASAHIQTARMDEFDVDLVLVSSHLGARPSHQEWQGKIYSRSGADPKYPDFVSSTGYGTGPGLCGWNCRHNFSPYFEGMTNPFEQYDSEENLKQYELEQRQRELERRIRKTKREVMNWKTAGDEEMYQRKSALLQKQNAAYNQFCEDNGLKKRADRINIARWDRKQAANARAAARKRINEVGEASAASNWYSISIAGGETKTKFRRLSSEATIDENIAATNPKFRTGGAPYRQNCQRCTAAYVMRRQGYDVIAKPAVVDSNGKLSVKDPLYKNWKNIFEGAKYQIFADYSGGHDSLVEEMNKWEGDGIGIVRVLWNRNEGHVFIAEKIGDQIRFVDPQNGDIDCKKYFTSASLGATMMARVDNLKPTDLIEHCIKNRGGK